MGSDATLARPMCNYNAMKNSLIDRWKMNWESLCAVLVEKESMGGLPQPALCSKDLFG